MVDLVNREHRAWIPLAIVGLMGFVVAIVIGLATTAGELAADEASVSQVDVAHIAIGVNPRSQEFFQGDDAAFTVAVTNTGTVILAGVGTESSSIGACARSNLGTLLPGQSTSYSCGQSNPPTSFLEVFTATAAAGAERVENSTDAFVLVKNSDLTIIKRPTSQVVRRGETARFTVIIFNNRPSPVTNVRVLDSGMPGCTLDPDLPLSLGTGENNSFDYPCQLKNVQGPVTGVAEFTATDPSDDRVYTASDVAWVELIELQAAIGGQPPAIPEPGGPVTFTVELVNSGSVDLEVATLSTTQFGNLFDAANPKVPAAGNTCLGAEGATIAHSGGALVCEFTTAISGPPSQVPVALSAGANDGQDNSVTANAQTSILITNLEPVLTVNLTADPPLVIAPGGPVQLTVRLGNASEADTLTIDTLEESALGNLDGVGDCEVPISGLGPAETYQCAFTSVITGQIGDSRVFIVNAAGFDDDPSPNAVSASGTLTVPVAESPEKLFLPQVVDTVVEPNDRCTRAFPLALNFPYFFRPPNTFPADVDYFEFFLERRQVVTVELTDFEPADGQIVVRRGPCDDLVIVGQNANPTVDKIVNLGSQPAGRYLIQIVNDGPPMSSSLYRLFVRTN